MRGRIEVIDDFEARQLPRPVDGGHVEEQVETEFGLESLRRRRAARRARGAPRACRGRRLRPGMPAPNACCTASKMARHDQNFSVTIGWLRACDPVLQPHDGVDHRLRAWRAARDVDVHRNDLVDAQQRRVVLVEPAAGGARAEGHHPFRLAHLLVDLEQDRRLLVRERADDHQQIGLPRRKARQRGAEAVGVVRRRAHRHELHRAARGDERIGEQRELARPADQLVLLRRQVLERRRTVARVAEPADRNGRGIG